MVLQRILTKVFISNIEHSTAIQVPLEIFQWTPGGSRTPGWEPLVYMVVKLHAHWKKLCSI